MLLWARGGGKEARSETRAYPPPPGPGGVGGAQFPTKTNNNTTNKRPRQPVGLPLVDEVATAHIHTPLHQGGDDGPESPPPCVVWRGRVKIRSASDWEGPERNDFHTNGGHSALLAGGTNIFGASDEPDNPIILHRLTE